VGSAVGFPFYLKIETAMVESTDVTDHYIVLKALYTTCYFGIKKIR